MSWLEDIQNHRKRQVNQMVKAFGCDEMDLQKAEDDGVDYTVDEPEEEGTSKTSKKKNTGKSNMYKMKMLGLRKFNDQDQKTYIGVEDADNSYITNLDNGDIIISKTDEGYLVSKFPIDENKEGEEKEATGLSEAIDIALQFKEELDNEEDNPEQIMYKETEKAFEDEVNPFEKAAYEAEFGQDIEKAKHQDGDMHPNGKWVWRSFANGGKGDWRVASPSKRGGGAKTTAASSDDGKKKNSLDTYLENQKKMQQIGKKTLPSDAKKIMDALKTNNSKYSDSSKVTVEATPKGNWRLYYDGKDTGVTIKGSVLSEDTIRDLNWEHHDVDNIPAKKDTKVVHDINGAKVTVTKNTDGSYTLEAKGKKIKSDDPSYFVNGTNLKPSVKKALAKEVGIEAKTVQTTKVPSGKKISYDDDIVAVYDDKGKKVYEGMLDYSPYQLDDSKWNATDKNYDLPKGYKMVGK